jgi:hypothetical protein
MRFSWILVALLPLVTANKRTQNLADLDYRVYPLRTEEEAAVLEWGHSAIISALDLSVAHFGPQTSQAALLEVECMPILASPLNGVGDRGRDTESDEVPIQVLDNADEVHGNMVVMTNNGGLTGVEMARVAKLSGAAALLVVNIEEKRPDDIYRLAVEEGESADDIDIPVVMVSLNSANVLTTATVTPEMQAADIVNHGMPERVRLYAGGDRPFFEDVEPVKPTLYLIHNLLTEEEAKGIILSAESKVSPVEKDDLLQMQVQAENFPGVSRVMLWQGMLRSPGQKAMEERIEQVTGFPVSHYSDWIVDKLEHGAQWKPHYDDHPTATAMATITVFLTEQGSPIVYPSSKTPVKVVPRRGMAIVHHNTNEKHKLDLSTVHAMLPHDSDRPAYVARKYVFTEPVSNARRIALPLFALPFGGKLPGVIISLHDLFLEKFGVEQGSAYFDKACVFVPLLIVLLIVQYIVDYVQKQFSSGSSDKKKEEKSASKTKGKKD